VAVLTLALGVGGNAAVFSLLDRLFNQPPPGVAEPETLRRLYVRMPRWIREDGRAGNFPAYSYAAFSAIEALGGGTYDVAAWTPSREEILRDGTLAMPVRTSFVSHDYFHVLGVAAELGRLFGEAEARGHTRASSGDQSRTLEARLRARPVRPWTHDSARKWGFHRRGCL
jgi:hypothetical protein